MKQQPEWLSWKCCTTSFLIVTLLFITLCLTAGLVIIPVLYAHPRFNYPINAVLFAAESDHTSVFVYHWDYARVNRTAIVHRGECCRVDGGLTSFDNWEDAAQSLLGCVHNLTSSNCSGLFKGGVNAMTANGTDYDIFFEGTDGMRILNHTNSSSATELLKSVREAIQTNLSRSAPVNASVMSGEDEGVAYWVHVNQDTLRPSSADPKNLTGIIHLGAGSAQLTQNATNSSLGTHVQVNLFNVSHTLLSGDVECAGWNETFKNVTKSLLSEESTDSYYHSCLPSGYNWTVPNITTDLYQHSCSDSGEPDNTATNVTFIGTGDVTDCLSQLGKITLPPLDHISAGNFTPLGRFHDVLWFFNLTSLNSSRGYVDFNASVTRFCNLTWSEIAKQYNNSGVSTNELSRFCYDGLLTHKLLTEVFGFNTNNGTWNISLAGNNYRWTDGYMLQQAIVTSRELASKVTRHSFTVTSLVLSLVLLLILIIMFLMFFLSVLHVTWTADRLKDGYIPIS